MNLGWIKKSFFIFNEYNEYKFKFIVWNDIIIICYNS